jgi:hypothetical protein
MTTAELNKLGYDVIGNRAVPRKAMIRAEHITTGPRIVRAFVPFAVTSEANRGGKLRAKITRKKLVKMAVADALWNQLAGRGQPKRVWLVLLVSRPMDAHDNLRMALKSVVDQIAAMCGFDDSADVWRYGQKRREHYEPSGVFVKVEF